MYIDDIEGIPLWTWGIDNEDDKTMENVELQPLTSEIDVLNSINFIGESFDVMRKKIEISKKAYRTIDISLFEELAKLNKAPLFDKEVE